MLRRERRPTMEKTSVAGPLIGPLAPKHIFKTFSHQKTVNGRFARKKSRLALMRVMRYRAPQRQPATHPDERRRSGGANPSVVLLRARIRRQMAADLSIRDEQSRRSTS